MRPLIGPARNAQRITCVPLTAALSAKGQWQRIETELNFPFSTRAPKRQPDPGIPFLLLVVFFFHSLPPRTRSCPNSSAVRFQSASGLRELPCVRLPFFLLVVP